MDVSQVGRASWCASHRGSRCRSMGEQRLSAGEGRVHPSQPLHTASALSGNGPSSFLPCPAPGMVPMAAQSCAAGSRFSWIPCGCHRCFCTEGHPPTFPHCESSAWAHLPLSSGISYSPWSVSRLTQLPLIKLGSRSIKPNTWREEGSLWGLNPGTGNAATETYLWQIWLKIP